MKKILCVLLALTSMFCLAACEDGKCDDCKTEENVKVYEIEEKDTELCPACLAKRGANNVIDGLFGNK